MNRLPAGPILFDTTIYVRYIRGQKYEWLEDPRLVKRTILTAVVAAELYAGTRTPQDKRALEELCLSHSSLGHFQSPSAEAWIQAGVLIRRARTLFGEMGFAHHFRDGLIGLEAVRARATLVSEDVAGFVRWKALIASSGMTLKLFSPS